MSTDLSPTGPSPGGARLRLSPGVRVVRRGRDRLQLGLDPDRRVVLPRGAAVERLLRELGDEEGTDPGAVPDPAALDLLLARDLVVPLAEPSARCVVRLLPDDATWPVPVETLVTTDDELGTGADQGVLVLAAGEPDRAALDPLVRDGVPHLVVSLVDGGVRVGPLVVPGRTACLRCVDAHRTADDPDHLAVLARYTDLAADGAPVETDPALVGLATAWAARDLVLHLRGRVAPATWSSTLTWHPRSPAPVARRWLRHPGCGCGWAAYAEPGAPGAPTSPVRASGARPSGTMEA